MSKHIGIYFPYFHFPSDEWVKLAALYWDGMLRIVPEGYVTQRDSEAVKALANKRAFIINAPPKHEDLDLVEKEFLKLVAAHDKELVRLYAVNKRSEWQNNHYTVKYAPSGADPKLAYIYSRKIEKELNAKLTKYDLGTRRSDVGKDFPWVGMHPKLANVYMAALAEIMAERRQAQPVAHDTENCFAVAGFTFERLAQVLLEDATITPKRPTKQEIESIVATIAVRAVMPKDIKSIPVEKILGIREKHLGELDRFQTFVQNVVNQLPELENVEVREFLHDCLEWEYKKQIKPQLDSLEETMKLNGIETVTNVLNLEIKTPLVLTSLGGLGAGIAANPVLGGTAAVALALLPIIGDRRKVYKDALNRSDVALLLHIQEDLAPVASLKWIASRVRKFIYGV
jgi:hypothetical protein